MQNFIIIAGAFLYLTILMTLIYFIFIRNYNISTIDQTEKDRIAKELSDKEKADKEKADKEKIAKELAAKEKADKDAKEKAAKDLAERQKAVQDQAERDRIAKEMKDKIVDPSHPNFIRTGVIKYAPIYDTVHQQIKSGFKGIAPETVYKLSEASLPNVLGYVRCPVKTLSSGPWVTINNTNSEIIKGENDLNKIADQCDLKGDCIGYTSYLKDGILYKMKDLNKTESLQIGQTWVPVYIKQKHFKSCDNNAKFNY